MPDHRLGATMRTVLDVLEDERRANPQLLVERTDLTSQQVSNSLRRLVDAGWVRKVTEGLYEYDDELDPRE